MLNNLRDLLILHEGRRQTIYKDSLGFDTIGVGHLVDKRKGGGLPPFIEEMLSLRGIDIYAGQPMPNHIIDSLLDYDIGVHNRLLHKAQPWTESLDLVRHAVLCDMTFNLGDEPFDHDGVKDWPIFVEQVRTGRYEAAAANMLNTTWRKQVKGRAVRLAEMMRTGAWPA